MEPWVRIDIVSTCAQQLERCADHTEASASDVQLLLDAIRCGHLAVLSAMIGALAGSLGVGAYSDKLRAKHLAYIHSHDRNDLKYPEERTLSYVEALRAVQRPGKVELGPPVELSIEEFELAVGLDFYRQLIDHPKPTYWSVPTEALREIVAFIPQLVLRIGERHHRFKDVVDRLHLAANRIATASA